MDGDSDEVCARLETEMAAASKAQEFERAARLRDQREAINLALERQQMVGERSEDIDVIGVAEDEFEAAVQVFMCAKDES